MPCMGPLRPAIHRDRPLLTRRDHDDVRPLGAAVRPPEALVGSDGAGRRRGPAPPPRSIWLTRDRARRKRDDEDDQEGKAADAGNVALEHETSTPSGRLFAQGAARKQRSPPLTAAPCPSRT